MKKIFIKWFNFWSTKPVNVKEGGAPDARPSKAYDTIRKFLDRLPNINRGGCGISTLVLFDHAEAAGLKPKIIFGYSPWGGGYEENQEYKKGNRQHAESASHIFIRMNGKDYDSTGEYERERGWVFDDQITRDHLVDSIRYGGWNPSFRRSEWLPKIEEFIGYKLV